MKKNTIAILLLVLAFAFTATAQDKKGEKEKMPKTDEVKVYKANPQDVASIDAIIKAVYDVISGDAGEKRDWDRFYSLFHKDGRLIPTGLNAKGDSMQAKAFTPAEYIKRSEPFMMKNGFFEKEIASRRDIYGNIAHVFSTYEGKNKLEDKKPLVRGINSFQLLNDGKRWWILTIYWQAESPNNLLPKKYLKTKK